MVQRMFKEDDEAEQVETGGAKIAQDAKTVEEKAWTQLHINKHTSKRMLGEDEKEVAAVITELEEDAKNVNIYHHEQRAMEILKKGEKEYGTSLSMSQSNDLAFVKSHTEDALKATKQMASVFRTMKGSEADSAIVLANTEKLERLAEQVVQDEATVVVTDEKQEAKHN